MTKKVKIDLITKDKKDDGYIIYLVEEGPWLKKEFEKRLRTLQDRLYDAVDIALDGHLAMKYPESKGKKLKIQVDLYDNAPDVVAKLVNKFEQEMKNNKDYRNNINESIYICELSFQVERK